MPDPAPVTPSEPDTNEQPGAAEPPPALPPKRPSDYRPDLRPMLILLALLIGVIIGWLVLSPLILPSS